MPAGRIRWAAPGTMQMPYKRRRETVPEALHSDEVWEQHKDTILSLRKNMTLQKVAEIMTSRGFKASQAQYKHHLKRWGDKKYLKFTDQQLAYVVRKIAGRLKNGEKAALRLNGEKIPSNKMDQYLRTHPEIVEKCANEGLEAEEVEEVEYTGYCEDQDTHGDAVMIDSSITQEAPTIIDSLRITIYTSSTAHGIRKIFPWRKGLLMRTRETDEEVLDTNGPIIPEDSSTRTSSEESSQLVGSVDTPSTSYAGTLDNLSYFETNSTLSDSPSHCTWDSISEEIFGRRKNSQTHLVFNPAVKYDPSTRKSTLLVKQDSLQNTFKYLRDLQYAAYVADGRERFMNFLSFYGQDFHLYRREVDINDCPDGVWAVDMLGWRAQVRRPGKSQPNPESSCEKDSKPVLLCTAWCVRPATPWIKWLSRLEQRNKVFKCGHSIHCLKADGPVIFVETLRKACWQDSGCQWSRTIDGSEDLAPGSYSPWSESVRTIQDIL